MEGLRARFAALGGKPGHWHWFLGAWLGALPCRPGASRQYPARLEAELPALRERLAAAAVPVASAKGKDGSVRRVLRLADGHLVESVLLPGEGVCVSTQVGCAVGCAFCMTGKSGLLRQLGDVEILAQVAQARALRPVRRVVFMGMGEPSHNFPRVADAIVALGTHAGLAHKNLVFSTVGDPKAFAKLLALPVRPALAVSLHTTDDALRRRLLPHAPVVSVEALMAEAETYARAVGYPIQYQWTLIRGVNDGDAEIDRLARLMRGRYAMVNFIPVNRVEASAFERPSGERIREISATLRSRGIIAKFRDSAGQDIEGGCGQLRARIVREGSPT